MDFSKSDHLKAIVQEHGRMLFQPFDQEGLRLKPLKLKVKPSETFKMQPCRFVRHSTATQGAIGPVRYLVSDNTCDFASPLVIVQKNESRIRMAVDY